MLLVERGWLFGLWVVAIDAMLITNGDSLLGVCVIICLLTEILSTSGHINTCQTGADDDQVM